MNTSGFIMFQTCWLAHDKFLLTHSSIMYIWKTVNKNHLMLRTYKILFTYYLIWYSQKVNRKVKEDINFFF